MTNSKLGPQRKKTLMIFKVLSTLTLQNNSHNTILKLHAAKLLIPKGWLNWKNQIKEKIFKIHLSRLLKNHRLPSKCKCHQLKNNLIKLIIKVFKQRANPQIKLKKIRKKAAAKKVKNIKTPHLKSTGKKSKRRLSSLNMSLAV